MKYAAFILCLAAGTAMAADLTISGQNNKTYDGGSYGKCVVTSSSNIIIRNCSFSSSVKSVVDIKSGCSNITLENCDVDGQNEACQLVMVNGSSNVTVTGCELHHGADDGFCVTSSSHTRLIGNVVRHLIGKGTDALIDGPCYNGHSDGIELSNIDVIEIAGNLIYDIKATSGMMLRGWEGTVDSLYLYNNIVYTPDVTFAVYVDNLRDARIFNNTFWKGKTEGLAVGANCIGVELKNNLTYTINFNHFGGSFNPANHDFGYNVVGRYGSPYAYTLQPTEIWSINPQFDTTRYITGQTLNDSAVTAEGFRTAVTSAVVNAGVSVSGVPATDYFGNARVGAVDIGAIEYQGAVSGIDASPGLHGIEPAVTVSPSPVRSEAVFTVSGAAGDRMVLTLYTRDGRTVRRIAGHPGRTEIAWDGRDAAGSTVPAGTYLYRMDSGAGTVMGQLVKTN